MPKYQARLVYEHKEVPTPRLKAVIFVFELGWCNDEKDARTIWQSLKFPIPEKARLYIEMIDDAYYASEEKK